MKVAPFTNLYLTRKVLVPVHKMATATQRGLISATILTSFLCYCVTLAHADTAPASAPLPLTSQTLHANHTIAGFISGYLHHVVRTSPFNRSITALVKVLSEPTSTGRSTEALYLASFAKIVWQFINGIAKPFLKTYLVPIQMLFTYMAPKMFLRDCFNVDTTALLSARGLSPFTIGPAAQAFFMCAVDIVAQVILCVKLLANMATSIF